MPIDKTPAMPFYGKDFYTDARVMRMTLEQQGLFVRMLWHQWAEGSVPADPKILARELGLNFRLVRRLIPDLLPLYSHSSPTQVPFKSDSPGRLVNEKLERIRAQVLARRKRYSEGAKLTNNKRYGSPSDDSVYATATIVDFKNGSKEEEPLLEQINIVNPSPPPARPLSEQQQAVGQVLKAWADYGSSPPPAGLVARWLSDHGLVTVLDKVHKLGPRGHLSKDPSYFFGALNRKESDDRKGSAAPGRDGRGSDPSQPEVTEVTYPSGFKLRVRTAKDFLREQQAKLSEVQGAADGGPDGTVH